MGGTHTHIASIAEVHSASRTTLRRPVARSLGMGVVPQQLPARRLRRSEVRRPPVERQRSGVVQTGGLQRARIRGTLSGRVVSKCSVTFC